MAEMCGRIGVGLGGDTWDPTCELPVGHNGFHNGPCDWSPDRRRWERDNPALAAGGTQCTVPPEGWHCTRDAGHDGPCAAVPTADVEAQRRIAEALADWSSARPWDTRHARNQHHWMLVAEALMSNDAAIVDAVNAYVRWRKDQDRAPEGSRGNAGGAST